MFNFSPAKEAVQETSNIAPSGSLSWAMVEVKDFNPSQNTGGAMCHLELTLYQGPWEGRKIYGVRLGDPRDELNSEAFRNMGFAAILQMCEAAGLVDVRNPDSYAWLNVTPFNEIVMRLDGKVVGVKLSIKKDTNGVYPDKNQVGDWLSPNPARKSNKAWLALCEGRTNLKPVVPTGPTAAARTTFSPNASQPAPATSFGLPPQGAPANPAGFGQVNNPVTAAQQTQPGMQQPQTTTGPQASVPASLPVLTTAPQPGAGQFGNAPAWLKNGQPENAQQAQPQQGNGADQVPF